MVSNINFMLKRSLLSHYVEKFARKRKRQAEKKLNVTAICVYYILDVLFKVILKPIKKFTSHFRYEVTKEYSIESRY